jgi:Pyrimidine dimer DNA glycosylase
VRIWDLPPDRLCRAHLLGEHRELHAIWSVLTGDKGGYRHHPETLRWEGRLAALYARHAALADEMTSRGYTHASPLDPELATGGAFQDRYVDPPEAQVKILRAKGCGCAV